MTLDFFLYYAISQALHDMQEGRSVSQATKDYLVKALEYAETGKEPHYDSRLGAWTIEGREGTMTVLERLDQLYNDAIEEGQEIDQTSLAAARAYFTGQPAYVAVYRPRLTLTPEGRVRAHWPDGTMREF